ncbi:MULTISPECIES: ferrous iron transport protein B [Clostridium]|uniref:Ferrous iron transport protein B n=1 Tax=Clostridium disporicum TaxID=84024 RepID=A0A174H187_9CLOT|nr:MULTISPECIES: ferrous iron transport protein B [Clostridium]MCD2503112.1 ferrous iron transport protein B [Clostridium sp. NSJ-145]MDU6340319.1 ferrous iron transport protein B [Clostridium sp.]CUO68644.1 ferrous iron transporter FeoB [Clostridium disporicum]
MKIALAGNPNSGKTTLFNLITGKSEKVGNWAGVTVDKKEGSIRKSLMKDGDSIKIIDLPGAYSMSPFTSEENVTRDFIKNENPNVIINIVDGTNLSRSLFFTTQLLELDIPVVIALNKTDLNKKQGTKIDIKALEKLLGCSIVETVSIATNNNGIESLIKKAIEVKGNSQKAPFDGQGIDLSNKKEVEENDKKRYDFVKGIVAKVEKRNNTEDKIRLQDKADRILAHKWLGLPIFAAVMWAVFSISQTYLGPLFADILVAGVDKVYAFVEGLLGANVSPLLSSILLDGIIGGVGAVIGFLPLIMILFFLIALLEDSGYMARIAVIMDRFFKKIGLSGKSIIPMIIGTGCAIPGIMATRTIKDERQRRTTAMLTPFMPCGAKLPVIALFAGVFFNDAAWVGTLMYFLGIFLIIIGALIVVRITGEKNSSSYFIMELPQYKVPSIKRATVSMFERGKAFIVKAGTIILLCNTVIQIMQSFNWQFQLVAEGAENTSILATIASPFAFILIPLGFGAWQLAAAAITGFIAKENVVGTLAVVYSITNFIDVEELALVSGVSEVSQIMGLTSVAALSYLMFNLFTPPCFAAIGAMNSEMEDKKWLWGGIGFQFATGYTVSFLVYQIGTLVTTGSFGTAFVPGLIAVAVIAAIIIFLMKKGSEKAASNGKNKGAAWEM